MKTNIPGDILLFGGQGPKQHLSDRGRITELERNLGKANELFKLFLQQCLDAFRSECEGLNEHDRTILGHDPSQFYQDTEALLSPPEAVHSHPITETVSLYIRQVLELVVFAAQSNVYPRIIEVSGVCTGLIPAVLAASTLSYESEEFLGSALHGFRLAFWVGLRSASACYDLIGGQPQYSPCVLSTFGWPTSQLEAALSEFHSQRHEGLDRTIDISAIFDDDVHSLSGLGHILSDFRSTMVPSSVQCRPAHVHGFYHGGSLMNAVVEQVLNDTKARGIKFPTWDTLHAPLRSSTTGARMINGSSCQSLLETVLRSIFVEACHWKTTREKLFDETTKYLGHDSKAEFRILCIGPGTRSLVQGAPAHDRLRIIDNVLELVDNNMDDKIAIVGMSLNYPGANCKEQLWDMLENASCTASKIPLSRFDTPAKLGDKLGNFLEDPFQFDPGFFNISPREAKSMDPQQRILLQAALEALEDSGYSPNSTPTFQKETFGVFIGVATNDYVDNLRQDIDVYYSPGTLRAFLSGRISYAFGFLGPSIVVDTACSSSLVALYQASQALLSGECTTALAGGVNTISSPDMYSGLARAHFLSPNGQCKPFDAAADGYCRSEGCGLVVLKKLSNAIEENDNIYGVIRGIGINQCGTAKSITHPDHITQAALFKQLLSSSRTAPDTVSIVEAHGTGTQAGDYAEVLSLSSTFGPRTTSNPLYLSSIKGNIGHAEAASGIAGLAKLITMIQKGKIPPQASFRTLNPRLADNIHNMIIPTQLTEWARPASRSPRRALLNNFGAAGSNAALILEEYVPSTKVSSGVDGPIQSRSYHILNLSAKSERALQLLRERFIAHIEGHPEENIYDLCYTTNARKQTYASFRLSATGSDLTQLADSLRRSTFSSPDLTNKGHRKTIFVFSGQGHIQRGMGAEVLSTMPSFRLIVDQCDKILSKNGFPTITPFLSIGPDLGENEDSTSEIIITQCALFVLEYALARSWIQWGLTPDIVVGHSIGEYAAMAIAGVLDVEDALLLTARRAKLITTKCTQGMSGMVTCRSTLDDLKPLLESDNSRFSGISIACLNSHEDIVVAGPIESLTRFIDQCNDNGIKAKRLKVPYGFHSSSMDPVLEDLGIFASKITLHKTAIVVGSSLEGKLLDSKEKIRHDYFVRHTRDAVNFHRVVEDIERSFPGTNLDFVEIGPFPSTESMIRRTIGKTHYSFLPSLKPTESPWQTLSSSLRSLFLRNYPIKWREIYGGATKPLTSLPKYPLNTSQYYVRFRDQSIEKRALKEEFSKPSFEFLGHAEPTISEHLASFHTSLTPLAPYIKAHSVAGVPLCPASVLMEVVLEALSMSQVTSNTSLYLLQDVVFEKPLVYSDHLADESSLQTDLDRNTGKLMRFSLSSKSQLHCSGFITRKSPHDVVDTFTRKSAFVKRLRHTLYEESGVTFDSFSPKTIYQVIFPRVVAYDKPFLTLTRLSVSESRLEGCGKFKVDSSLLHNKFICHPAFLDTLLHAPGFIANTYVPSDIACICVSIERAYLPATKHLKEGELTIYCNLTDLGHSVIADAYIIDLDENIVAFIEGSCFKKILLKSFNNHLSRSLRASQKLPPIEGTMPPQKTLIPSVSRVEETVRSIVQECCGVFLDPSSNTTLVEAGVDSLMLIEITQLIRDRFPHIQINDASLESCSTLQELTSVISNTSTQKPLLKISTPELTHRSAPKAQGTTLPPTPPAMTPNNTGYFSLMKSLIFETCGIQIEAGMMDLELGALGVDSLLSIELGDELRERFGFVIDDNQHNIPELTFNQLEEILHANMRTPSDASTSPGSRPNTSSSLVTIPPETTTLSPPGDYDFQKLIQRQTTGPQKSNSYLFHDGSGHCSMYARMSSMNRNITGVFSPDLPANVKRLEDLASLYIKRTNLINEREVVLGGWSFGGVLAFEVSRQLRSLGRVVKGLILIDSPPPVDHKALPEAIVSHVLGQGVAGDTTYVTEASKQARERIKQRFHYHAMLLQNYHPEPRTDDVPCVMLKCSRSMDTQRLCNVAYPWVSDDDFRARSVGQWEELTGRSIPVLDIACNHFQVFDAEYVGDVSEKLMLAYDMLDR